MERLKERINIANKAVSTFAVILKIETPSDIERDAAIQRFEYSFEAVWKTAKRCLRIVEGIDANSPKAVIRASFDSSLLDEEDAKWAMVMADDRNLTSHTYNETLAEQILSRLPNHLEVLQHWLQKIGEKV